MKENAMTNLNSKEIKTLIKGYIQEKSYPYAIMIDGSWGSGKTYFVKNQLIPDVKCLNIESIYVSLYGVRNEESITKQIL